MKKKSLTYTLVVFMAGGLLSACGESEKKADAGQTKMDSLAQLTFVAPDTSSIVKEDWGKFKMDADNRIKRNEDSITTFKKRIAKEDVKLKGKYDKEIIRLENKNNEMKAKLSNYKEEGKVKFEKFKTEFIVNMDSIDANISEFYRGDKN